MSVLSVLTELTVWCKDGSFVWSDDGSTVTHPIDDPVGAAQRIADRHRHPNHRPAEDHSPTGSVHEHTG
ncbi:hypothetical protein [Nonomuraea sp. NPDC050310]|uniref:hypothetical protein n=1 Tax=unclassified Nonomuraea TaxID=2593643 RepID=UPI0033FD3010